MGTFSRGLGKLTFLLIGDRKAFLTGNLTSQPKKNNVPLTLLMRSQSSQAIASPKATLINGITKQSGDRIS
ncbi:hypothetical protein [Cylindrospermopsis sp. CR12]|uniref:hypothetical protein n=1 Tax=Cylindrospermopsis sp. CR12 TaxID=1747196 RepID=UPI0013798D4E|nr:hypothetical protein [Cylindrospermopsis sp. CR12]MBU6346250.1 hypothetical protein [Cyanobacteria bacterium REEB494]